MRRRQRCIWCVPGLALLLATCGCGGNTVGVKGRVTYDGKPVETGSISFESADGNGPTSGGVIQDGRYELTDKAKVSPGPKIVRIRGSRKTGRKVPIMRGSSQLMEEVENLVPAEYNDKSTLKAEVEPGKINEFNFDLKQP